MEYTAREIALCSFALHTQDKMSQEGQFIARQLTIDEMGDGVSANKKLKTRLVDNTFTDGDIELSTTEKALLLKLLERPWSVDDAEVFIDVKKKLL